MRVFGEVPQEEAALFLEWAAKAFPQVRLTVEGEAPQGPPAERGPSPRGVCGRRGETYWKSAPQIDWEVREGLYGLEGLEPSLGRALKRLAPSPKAPSAAGGSGLWQGLCRPAALPRRPAPRRLSGGGLPNPLPQGSGLFLWPRGLPLIPAGEHPLFQKPGGHVSPFAGDLDRPAGQRLHPAAKQAAALRLHHPGG